MSIRSWGADAMHHDEPGAASASDAAIALAAAVGDWATVVEAVAADEAAHGARASPASDRAPTALAELDRVGLAAVAETHTGDSMIEFRALQALVSAPRSRNLLTAEHALALTALGTVQHVRGHWGEAALDLRRAIGLMPPELWPLATHARLTLAFVRVRQGRWNDADDIVRQVQDAALPIQGTLLEPQLMAVTGLLLGLRDDPAAAPALARAAARAEHAPSVLTSMILFHARTAGAIARNDWVGLHRLLDDGEDPGYRRPFRDDEWRALRLLAAWHVGNSVEFARRIAEWSALPGALDQPYFWAFRSIEEELAGRFVEGGVAIRRALDLVSLDLDPLGRTWIRILAGTFLSRYGAEGQPDPVAGLTAYEDALRELQELGASAFARLCENIIVQTSAELSGRQADPLAVLTVHQAQIAQLVADGYTSVEISQILHLSKKTIDFHVGNIVRRLGLSSRREIPRLLRGRE